MADNTDLLASAFSAYLGIPITTETEARSGGLSCNVCTTKGCALAKSVPINTASLFGYPLHHADDNNGYAVRLFGTDKVLTGINPESATKDILSDLNTKFGVTSHALNFGGGIVPSGNATIGSIGIPQGRTLYALGGDSKVHPTYYINKSDLEPSKDFDFTDYKGEKVCERGNYRYERPIGWYRYALKVIDKYANNTWLGEDGMRTKSSPGEWAVSYHGTQAKFIRDIAHDGFDDGKRKRQLYGPGVYSTPTLKVAASYSITFKHKGSTYKMMLQNRVDLKKSKEIPASTTGVGGPYFVTKNDRDIRPYGVLLQKQ